MSSFDVQNGEITDDYVGLFNRNYTTLFYDLLDIYITDFNVAHQYPIDLSTKNSKIAWISQHILSQLILTPFVLDENLFLGGEFVESEQLVNDY